MRPKKDILHQQLADMELKITEMVRDAEKAQLERQRLVVEVERGRRILEQITRKHSRQ